MANSFGWAIVFRLRCNLQRQELSRDIGPIIRRPRHQQQEKLEKSRRKRLGELPFLAQAPGFLRQSNGSDWHSVIQLQGSNTGVTILLILLPAQYGYLFLLSTKASTFFLSSFVHLHHSLSPRRRGTRTYSVRSATQHAFNW